MSAREDHKANCAKVDTEHTREPGTNWGWNRCTGCGFTYSDRDAEAVELALLELVDSS